MKNKDNLNSVKTPATYGKNHAVTKFKNALGKVEETSGNMTLDAYQGKIKEAAKKIHDSCDKATDRQMAYILDKVSRRAEHGFQWLTGNEKKLSVDKVLKLNVNLTKEQLAEVDKAIANRKQCAKGGTNPIKKAASSLLGSKHSELIDIPKLRYGKGDELRVTIESVCDTKAIKRLASGKTLLEIAG